MSPGELADQSQYFMILEAADSVCIWGEVIMRFNADVNVIWRFTSAKKMYRVHR